MEFTVFLVIVAVAGLVTSALLVVLLNKEYEGRWKGEVVVILESFVRYPCYDGRPLCLRSYDRVYAFRLLDLLPGRGPEIKVQESFGGGSRMRFLRCDMQWHYALGSQPYLEIQLPQLAGQMHRSPFHELTLWVRAHEKAEPAEYTVEWAAAAVVQET